MFTGGINTTQFQSRVSLFLTSKELHQSNRPFPLDLLIQFVESLS